MRGGVGGLNVEINELRGKSLDLHLPPASETDLIKGRSVYYNSVSPVEGTEGVEFHIPADPECFFILNQARLEGHLTVEDDNGGPVSQDDIATMSNHFGACLFSQIEIYLNGTQVCDLSAPFTYPYKHYIDTTLSYQFGIINCVGKSEGYYKCHREGCGSSYDEDGVQEDVSCLDLAEIHKSIHGGKKMYFSSTIPADILHTNKYLPPNVEISIKLARLNTSFGICQYDAAKTFRLILKDLKLRMRKVLPSEGARARFRTKLLQSPCFLPYKDSQLKNYHIPQGSTCFSANHINNQLLPNQIIFAIVESVSLSGAKSDRWPLYFRHCHMSSIVLKKNGKPVLPKPLECDFEAGDYVELYEHFQSNVGSQNLVTLKNFKDGFTFLAFDLTPDKCGSYHNHPPASGSLELDLTFDRATSKPYTLISYAFYNSGITVDKYFQVTKIKY